MDSLLGLILLPQDLSTTTADDDLAALDGEDAGFQSSFAKLGASEARKEDPVAYVGTDEKAYLNAELTKVSAQVRSLPLSSVLLLRAYSLTTLAMRLGSGWTFAAAGERRGAHAIAGVGVMSH